MKPVGRLVGDHGCLYVQHTNPQSAVDACQVNHIGTYPANSYVKSNVKGPMTRT